MTTPASIREFEAWQPNFSNYKFPSNGKESDSKITGVYRNIQVAQNQGNQRACASVIITTLFMIPFIITSIFFVIFAKALKIIP
jgi:hypothetical protein